MPFPLTHTRNLGPNPSLACPGSNMKVQLLEDNVRDERRRCPICGRMMTIRPIRMMHGVTLGYKGVAILSEHRPHT